MDQANIPGSLILEQLSKVLEQLFSASSCPQVSDPPAFPWLPLHAKAEGAR